MRVAVLVEHFPPKMGSDRRIYELMRRLTGSHEINFLLIPSFRELCDMIKPQASNFSNNQRNNSKCEGIIPHYIEIPNSLRRLWKRSFKLAYVLSTLLLVFQVTKKLKKLNPQIIVLNYPSVYTGILGFFAAKFLHRRCIVDFNDLIAQYTISLLDIEKSKLTSRIIVWIQDFIVRNAHTVVVPTNYVRKYALSCGAKDKNVFVIPNGVDTQAFSCKKRTNCRSELSLGDKNVCLYFGRLDEWAGVDILSEVSSIFEQKRPDITFLIAGSGSKKEFPQNVVTVEEVPYHEVPKIISAADVVLIPFPENEVSHAASPLKLFEAMAMRKPVVASEMSGICDVVEDGYNGLLVKSNESQEWVQAVESVLNSKLLQRKLGKNARESVKNYDWNVLASQLENTLLNLEQIDVKRKQIA